MPNDDNSNDMQVGSIKFQPITPPMIEIKKEWVPPLLCGVEEPTPLSLDERLNNVVEKCGVNKEIFTNQLINHSLKLLEDGGKLTVNLETGELEIGPPKPPRFIAQKPPEPPLDPKYTTNPGAEPSEMEFRTLDLGGRSPPGSIYDE